MTDYRALLAALNDAGAEYILVGGLAATVHGSARFTADVDVVYLRTDENFAKIARALGGIAPYLRGAPQVCCFASTYELCAAGSTLRSRRVWDTSIC